MTVETSQRLVRVKDRSEGTFPLRWVQLMDGEKSGNQISVPVIHPAYHERMEDELQKLEEDDILKMRFTSMNEKNTSWACSEIATRDGEIITTQSITYQE